MHSADDTYFSACDIWSVTSLREKKKKSMTPSLPAGGEEERLNEETQKAERRMGLCRGEREEKEMKCFLLHAAGCRLGCSSCFCLRVHAGD